MKKDLEGNINTLQKTYEKDPPASEYLLAMIQRERDAGKTEATVALLWLKRTFEFISAFLKQIQEGNENMVQAARIAYDATIKKYHNFIVRGVSAMMLNAMPRFSKFVEDMAPSPEDWKHPDYMRQLLAQCAEYITALTKVLNDIDEFYKRSNLDVD
ncbi:pleckstrin homology domain-containing family A member 8-like [Ornithodoros turicata]|uniref:pleckstrin homology domain-containing family A member 8-like n=1 Tax=Ornithodoros turicata TaxID=34597 RepID=UPI003139914A